MDDLQNTPSIIDREITSFRCGQRLAYGDLTGREKRDYLFDAGIRTTAEAKPRLYLGMPANTFQLGAFLEFLFDCAKDPKLAAEYVVPEIDSLMREKGERLGLVDRHLVYRAAGAIVRERLLMLRGRFEPLLPYPEWGPGRVDTFNAVKVLF